MRYVPLFVFVLFACRDARPPSEPAPERPADAAAPARSPLLALPAAGGPARVEPDAPGPVWLATSGSGLVRLDDDGFHPVKGFPESVRRVATGPGGVLWVLGHKTLLRRAANGQIAHVPLPDQTTLVSTLAPGPGGEVWMLGLYAVHRLRGTRWTRWDKKEDFDPPLTGTPHLAVDAEGRAWIGNHEAVHVFDPKLERWTAWSMLGPPAAYVGPLAFGPQTLLVYGGSQLHRVRAGAVRSAKAGEGMFFASRLARAADGTVWMSHTLEARALGPDGEVRRVRPGADFNARAIAGLDVDRTGRAWLATGHGLVVVAREGVRQWPPGTVPIIRHGLADVAVSGRGPTRLPAAERPAEGRVTGRVVGPNGPVAGVQLELCPQPDLILDEGETPCGEAAIVAQVSSGADGRFATEPLPVSAYGVAIRAADGRWKTFLGRCCAEMKSEAAYDLGDLSHSGMGVLTR